MAKGKDLKGASKGAMIHLGGKDRYLKFDLNAFAELEDLYGSVEEAMEQLNQGSIKALRALLWVGVIHDYLDENDEPTITLRTVGSWIDVKDLPDLSEKLSITLEEALPAEEEGAPPPSVPLAQTEKKSK